MKNVWFAVPKNLSRFLGVFESKSITIAILVYKGHLQRGPSYRPQPSGPRGPDMFCHYNFWSIHAIFTSFINVFGTIFIWTNLLIQCQRPVPVFYCFWKYRKKFTEPERAEIFCEFFLGIYVIFGRRNQRKTMPEGPTWAGGAATPLAAPCALVGDP